MRVKLRYFASIRELIGIVGEEVTLQEGSTVDTLIKKLKMDHVGLRDMDRILVAVDGEYVEPDILLREGDVVALFPPVSGG
jgi:molybdopterin synthase sulfur carrier subunit